MGPPKSEIIIACFVLTACLFVPGSLSAEDDVPVKLILEQALVVPSPDVIATMVVVTIPPGDQGDAPHFHSGPTVGFVFEGELLFQVNDDPPRILRTGDAFFEKDGDTHVWAGNPSNTTTTKVVATVFGRPGQPVTTYREYPRTSFADALAAARRSPKA